MLLKLYLKSEADLSGKPTDVYIVKIHETTFHFSKFPLISLPYFLSFPPTPG